MRTRRPSTSWPATLAIHRDFERLGRRQLGKDSREAGREQRLARAGRSAHQQIVPARRGDLERALGRLLPLHLGEVRTPAGRIGLTRLRRRQRSAAAQMVEERDEVGCGDHLDRPRPGGLRPLPRRADQAELGGRGMEGGEQHPRRRRDPAIETEFADDDKAGDRLLVDHTHRAEQAERDRQIVMRALLGQIGGREVDRDPFGRERKADRGEGGAHPLAALRHRLVREADDDEGGKPAGDLHLDLDRTRLEAEKGDRGDVRDHLCTPGPSISDGFRTDVEHFRQFDGSPDRHQIGPNGPDWTYMSMRERVSGLTRVPLVRQILVVTGCLLMAVSPLVGAVPGPGGVFVFAAGLSLSLKYSGLAKRLYVRFKKRYPNKGRWADWGLRRASARRREEMLNAQQRREAQAALSATADD